MKLSHEIYAINTLLQKWNQEIQLGKQQYLQVHTFLINTTPYLKNDSVQLVNTFHQIQDNMKRFHMHITESIKQYQNVEYDCQRKARAFSLLSQQHPILSSTYKTDKNSNSVSNRFTSLLQASTETQIHTKGQTKEPIKIGEVVFDTMHNLQGKDALKSLITQGFIGNIQAAFHGIKAQQHVQTSKFSHMYGEMEIGNIELSGKAHGLLWKDKKIDPSLLFDVGASASFAKGLLLSQWDFGILSLNGAAQGSIAEANAEGKITINKKEITMQGEVGASLAKGKIYGEFKIFGISIKAEVEGEVGGIGIGGSFSSKNNSFEIGGKFSCLLGGGMNLKISW